MMFTYKGWTNSTLHPACKVEIPIYLDGEILRLGAISLKLSSRRKGGGGRSSRSSVAFERPQDCSPGLVPPFGLHATSLKSQVNSGNGTFWLDECQSVWMVVGEEVRGIGIVQGLLYSAPNSLGYLR